MLRHTGLVITLYLTCYLNLRPTRAATGFIRVSNGRFVDEDCKEFVANGLNT